MKSEIAGSVPSKSRDTCKAADVAKVSSIKDSSKESALCSLFPLGQSQRRKRVRRESPIIMKDGIAKGGGKKGRRSSKGMGRSQVLGLSGPSPRKSGTVEYPFMDWAGGKLDTKPITHDVPIYDLGNEALSSMALEHVSGNCFRFKDGSSTSTTIGKPTFDGVFKEGVESCEPPDRRKKHVDWQDTPS
ncbi:hypothetical protein SESBI_07295 [Sesbania bispinosa]|nr:hypothetical protein SESBI_07295 [Sesbania bispinosa]